MPRRHPPRLLLLLAWLALALGAPAASASPPVGLVALAQQTGGSFGGSRWGSGAPSPSPSPSGGSWSGGRTSSPSSGSWSGGRSSSRSDDGSAFDLALLVFYLVVWCFSVSPILGFAVLGVALGFLLFVWNSRS